MNISDLLKPLPAECETKTCENHPLAWTLNTMGIPMAWCERCILAVVNYNQLTEEDDE
jgi:hypothetical protein